MKRGYFVPIKGKVICANPLEGDEIDYLRPIPLEELTPFPKYYDAEQEKEVREGYTIEAINYDLETGLVEVEIEASEALHAWIQGILPDLKNIAEAKGWKFDKSVLKGLEIKENE